MYDNKAIIYVCSNDIAPLELKDVLCGNDDRWVFIPHDEKKQRGLQSTDWLMFVMTAIPVIESAINIVKAVKNEIKEKLTKYCVDYKILKKIKVVVKISLPFFSYEKEEEIIVMLVEEKRNTHELDDTLKRTISKIEKF